MSGFWPIGPQADASAVIYELPDLDHFLRPAAVPVIAIPLARPPVPAAVVCRSHGELFHCS